MHSGFISLENRWSATAADMLGAGSEVTVFIPGPKVAAPPPSLHARVIPLGAGLLASAFVTDLLYSQTLSGQWETFSIWLLTAGLILAAVSGLVLLLDLTLRRVDRISWPRFLALTAAALMSLLNAFIHSRDGYTAVAPSGLALSAAVTLILIYVGRRGWSLSNRSPAA
jgi:uncharacterized membrane protein